MTKSKRKKSSVSKLYDLVKISVAEPRIHKDTKRGHYLRGMANGLICALAVFKDWEPIYVESPDKKRKP